MAERTHDSLQSPLAELLLLSLTLAEGHKPLEVRITLMQHEWRASTYVLSRADATLDYGIDTLYHPILGTSQDRRKASSFR